MSTAKHTPVTTAHREEGVVRLAAELRTGYGLLFEHDTRIPFRLTPARAATWRAGGNVPGLVWGWVTDLEPLTVGGSRWRPPVYFIALYCTFPAGTPMSTLVASDTPVMLQPSRPPYPRNRHPR